MASELPLTRYFEIFLLMYKQDGANAVSGLTAFANCV